MKLSDFTLISLAGLASTDYVALARTGSNDKVTVSDLVNKGLSSLSSINIAGTITGIGLAGALTGTVGATTPNTGAFTTLSASGAVTLSGGTANGVGYLNGSKVFTTGSALTFSGTVLATNNASASFASGSSSTAGVIVSGAAGTQGVAQFGSSQTTYNIQGGPDYLGLIYNIAAGSTSHQWAIGASEQMRLTNKALMVGYTSDAGFTGQYNAAFAGNVGIGTSSPRAKLDVNGGIILGNSQNLSWGGVYGANIPLIAGSASVGLDFYPAGSTLGLGMRLDSTGSLVLGMTDKVNINSRQSNWVSSLNSIALETNISSTNNYYPAIFYNNSATAGYIYVAGTVTTYNSISDYRLKDVIGAVTNSGSRIDALEPIDFEWKSDGTKTRGFLAHKFQEVYPNSVTGEKDAIDDEGNPVYQCMQAGTAEVIADLVAEIQSLRKRIATLEAK